MHTYKSVHYIVHSIPDFDNILTQTMSTVQPHPILSVIDESLQNFVGKLFIIQFHILSSTPGQKSLSRVSLKYFSFLLKLQTCHHLN